MEGDDIEVTMRKTPFPAHLRSVRSLPAPPPPAVPRHAAAYAVTSNYVDGLSMALDPSASMHIASPMQEEFRAQHRDGDDDDAARTHGADHRHSADSAFTGEVSPMTRPSDSSVVAPRPQVGTKRPLPMSEDLSGDSSVLDVERRTHRAPPRTEADVPYRVVAGPSSHSRSAPASSKSKSRSNAQVQQQLQYRGASAEPLGRESNGATALVCLSAELDFQGREITQLVNALVKRQQGQLRDLFDEMAAGKVAAAADEAQLREDHEGQVEELQDALRDAEARWADERKRLHEGDASKQCLIDCLQSEVAMKSDSLRLLTEQLSSTQSRLDTANARLAALTMSLATAEAKAKSLARQHDDGTTPTTGGLAARSTPNTVRGGKAVPAEKPKLNFVLTGFRSAERLELEALIRQLGGTVVACAADKPLPAAVTHIVCGSLTPKAIAGLLKQGTVVCPAEYVRQCTAKGEWLSPTLVRAIVGDGEEWLAAYPAVTAAAAGERDAGTQEVCSVLEASGIRILPPGTRSDDGLLQVPPLVAMLNEMKPAFLH
jgi:hypothetical protein